MEPPPSNNLNDASVAAQDKFRDPEALERFVEEIYPAVSRICRQVTWKIQTKHRSFDHEDLTQNVCLKIWRSLPSYDPERGSFRRWVTVIAFSSWKDLVDSPPMPSLDEEALTNVPSLEDPVERTMARANFRLLQARLPPDGFDLLMKNASGSSAEDIASADDVNVNTVKSRLKTVRARALSHLADEDDLVDDADEEAR